MVVLRDREREGENENGINEVSNVMAVLVVTVIVVIDGPICKPVTQYCLLSINICGHTQRGVEWTGLDYSELLENLLTSVHKK